MIWCFLFGNTCNQEGWQSFLPCSYLLYHWLLTKNHVNWRIYVTILISDCLIGTTKHYLAKFTLIYLSALSIHWMNYLQLWSFNFTLIVYTVVKVQQLILTWYRGYLDQQGGSPRSRPFHCTPVGLNPAIIPNADYSGTLFFSVGVCVRANPWP